MAEYPLFSQPEGPKIDISLFPEAMKAGAAVGNQVKTPLQGIAEAVTGGIQAEENVRMNEANIALKQAQIEQIPIEMQIKQQQLENQKAEIQVNLLKTQIEQTKLANDINVNAETARNELSVQQGIGEVNTALSSQSPSDLNGLLGSKNALAAMNKDKGLRDAVVGRALSIMPEGPERDAWANYNSGQKELDRQEKDRQINAAHRAKMEAALDADTTKAKAVLSTVLNGRDLSNIKNIEMYPEGQKVTDANGMIIKDNENTTSLGPRSQQYYEVFENGKKTGSVVAVQDYEKFNNVKAAYNSVNGTGQAPAAQSAKQQFTEENPLPIGWEWMGQGPKNKAQGTQGQPQAKPPITGNDRIVEQKIKELNDKILPNVPPGLSSEAMQKRFKMTEDSIKNKYSTPTPNNISRAPAPLPATPQKSNVALSDALNLGAPATLHLTSLDRPGPEPLDAWTPNEKSWTAINTNPLTAGESAFTKGLIYVESGGNPNAISPTGVRGILQVTKAVAQHYGLNRDVPEENLLAGKKYIADLLTQFNGDYRLALTAYNVGPGVVRDAIRHVGSTDWPDVQAWMKENLAPKKYAEVQDYANKVIAASSHFVQKGNPADEQFVSSLAGNGLVKVGGSENLFNKPLEEVMDIQVQKPTLPKEEAKPVTPETTEVMT